MAVEGRKFQDLIQEEFQIYKSKNRRYSLRSFAKHLEIAPTTLHQYLNGLHEPNRKNFLRLAIKLQWPKETVNEFLGRHRSMLKLPTKYINEASALTEEGVKLMSLSAEGRISADIDEIMQRLSIPNSRRENLEAALQYFESQGYLFVTEDFLEFTAVLKRNSGAGLTRLPVESQIRALNRLRQAVISSEYSSFIVSSLQLDPSSMKAVESEFNRFLQRLQEKYVAKEGHGSFEVLFGVTLNDSAKEMP